MDCLAYSDIWSRKFVFKIRLYNRSLTTRGFDGGNNDSTFYLLLQGLTPHGVFLSDGFSSQLCLSLDFLGNLPITSSL
ncbi:hypothetical protein SUGI_0608480 [Cryptomeria japonica]|nr:hypothetical protein SUGI_0608480 [Cryptomeria japonica]